MIEKGEFNSPLREPLNELMASCLESGLKRLSSFWMSGLFVETRCFASFPRQVHYNISGRKIVCITDLVWFYGYFAGRVLFYINYFVFELILVFLLLNIALPGRVLCDSSGRKHIKSIYILK